MNKHKTSNLVSMTDRAEQVYNPSFFLQSHEINLAGPTLILPSIFKLIPIDSVIDVGCGIGTWLEPATRLGATRILGLEGPWLDLEQVIVPKQSIVIQDLESGIAVSGRWDLAISLEVAEHISRKGGRKLVESLCKLSDLILFSAAIPGQGGTNHINECWQSEWAQQFREMDYSAYDFIRPKIWSNKSVAVYYRQNIVVYGRKGSGAGKVLDSKFKEISELNNLDVVHPEVYEPLNEYRKKKKNRWWSRWKFKNS